MHIHKTAGTSATNSFAHGFRDNEVCPFNFEYQFTRENLINNFYSLKCNDPEGCILKIEQAFFW